MVQQVHLAVSGLNIDAVCVEQVGDRDPEEVEVAARLRKSYRLPREDREAVLKEGDIPDELTVSAIAVRNERGPRVTGLIPSCKLSPGGGGYS